ncbi:metal-dependent hydrolase [Leptospira kobayashii]|uniref:Metal-dependent hydrolase n=1 Tax=Leptospira kobayashii TaxID=1917830 RepID=A0ABN6KFP5_9LEPT|nr:amidohydrolase family protein [Leptospira kobayashii]BDA78267.1 metal-dependent hydrolase [Leptospira kobayashii]
MANSNRQILPCYACFAENGKDSYSVLSANSEEKRLLSPFRWKGNDFPPLLDDQNPSHLKELKKLNIPYVFDIHSHFFPEIVLKLIWKWFDKVNWEIAYRYGEEERVKRLHLNGIRRFTTLNYAHKPAMAEWLNDWTYSNYGNWEGAIPFGTFYPEEGVDHYVKRAVEEYGFQGFKLHCEVSKLDLSRKELTGVFSYLEKLSIPLVIHTGNAPLPGEFTGIKYFLPFIQRYPGLKVIVAHMGAKEIFDYSELIDTYPNLYLDTTMVFVDFLATGEDADDSIPLLEKYQDRIFFGSDFPNIPYNLSHPIMRILETNISDEAKRKILWKNGENFFNSDSGK